MSLDLEENCVDCGRAIPEGTAECPGCGAALIFCFNPDCCKPLTCHVRQCPACGRDNEEYTPPSAPPPVTPTPAPAGNDNGLSQLLAALGGAAPTSADALPPAGPTGAALAVLPLSTIPRTASAPLPPSAAVGLPSPLAGSGWAGETISSPVPTSLPGAGSPRPLWGATAVAPLRVEVRFPQGLREGQQGVFRIQLTAVGLTQAASAEVVAASDLFGGAEQRSDHVAPGGLCTLQGITFIPRRSGSDEVRLTLTLRRPDGLPLGRWSGSHEVTIAETVGDRPRSIIGELIGTLPNRGEIWQSVALHPDLGYERRLQRTCPTPATSGPPPISAKQVWPAQASPRAAVVRVRDQHAGRARALAVVCGTSVALGRGGNPAVAWWLQPAPFDEYQLGRLSRHHATLDLRDGRAWLTDRSTNGVWLNGHRLPKDKAEVLADGDLISPAEVVPLRVALVTGKAGVHGVVLEREDALKGRLAYLLTDCRGPVPVTQDQAGNSPWLAWAQDATGQLLMAVWAGRPPRWHAHRGDGEKEFTQHHYISWCQAFEPLEQAACLE